jgi:hypothetical protein
MLSWLGLQTVVQVPIERVGHSMKEIPMGFHVPFPGCGVLLGVLLLLASSGSAAVSAQQASPAAGSITLPVAPAPAECTAQPLTVDELLARMGGEPLPATPGSLGAGGTPLPAPPFALPEGEPADPDVVAAVTETLVQFFPCRTAGNWLAVFAFYTDDFLQQLREEATITRQDLDYFRRQATPEPIPADQYDVLLGLREVRVLPDGRVGALVDQEIKVEEGLEVDYVFFEYQGGRWLIDEAVLALEEQYPPRAATPAP